MKIKFEQHLILCGEFLYCCCYFCKILLWMAMIVVGNLKPEREHTQAEVKLFFQYTTRWETNYNGEGWMVCTEIKQENPSLFYQ